MDTHAKTHQMKADLDIVALKAGNIANNKKRHYIVINGSIIKENRAIL